MSDRTDKLASLRELYPEGVEKLEAEDRRIQDLLKRREYYTLPATQEPFQGLQTFDGSHLDQPSAERWSQAFFQAVGSRARSWIDEQGAAHP
jgi:hypothetical protein